MELIRVKLAWINPTVKEVPGVKNFNVIEENLNNYFKTIAHKDTTVTIRNLPKSTNSVRSFYGEFLNNWFLVEEAIKLEKEGFDGIIIGCFPDPGLFELREILNIPVIGLGESAILTSLMIGYKFAIVSVDDDINPNMERSLMHYGVRDRAIYRPIRAVKPPITAKDDVEGYSDPFKSIIPRFEDVAKECINDGAEVIITGCGYIGPMLMLHGYKEIPGTRVPVLDSSGTAIKTAEKMVELYKTIGLRTSRRNYFKTPKSELINQMRKNVGLI